MASSLHSTAEMDTMPDRVPELHMELLEAEVAGLREDDFRWALEQYARVKPELRLSGQRLVDDMLRHLEQLERFLTAAPGIEDRHRRVATAALKYFLKDSDLISDDHHLAGLVDDALVVRAAMIELKDVLLP